MTASAEPRTRHRRRVTGRRALTAGSTAPGITGAARVSTPLPAPAGTTCGFSSSALTYQ